MPFPGSDEMTHIKETTPDPAHFLVENVDLLPRGRVLDVAMGSGRNSIAGIVAEK